MKRSAVLTYLGYSHRNLAYRPGISLQKALDIIRHVSTREYLGEDISKGELDLTARAWKSVCGKTCVNA
jgi:hypothetical protein